MIIPIVSKDILDYLEHVFPDKLPASCDSLEHLNLLQGQQNVVRLLQHQYNQQQKNPLKGNPLNVSS